MPSTHAPHYNPSMDIEFAPPLLTWYRNHARPLPWRMTTDPYAIWVSEVMLQQTRVETVIPYYGRWMERLPTIRALAGAGRHEVLSLWEGLGYYQRAHNLHRAAGIIVEEYEGRIPDSPQALKRLPGIGPYIASAIRAFAFNRDTVALDGNLRRVFSRLLDLDEDPRAPVSRRLIISQAKQALPSGAGSAYNQALMDLGAMICTPRQPTCDRCPVSHFCRAFAQGTQEERPVRAKKARIPHHTVTAGVLERDGRVLIARRPESGLLGGLWEFPGGKVEGKERLAACLRRELIEELGITADVGDKIGLVEHAYTHFRVSVHAFACRAGSREPRAMEHTELRWVTVPELTDFPMGKVDREISRILLKRQPDLSP